MLFAFLGNIGAVELVIILIVALMIFGNKLPEVVRGASRSIGQFKRSMEEASNQVRREMEQAAAEADPRPEIRDAVSGALTDDSRKPDDNTVVEHPSEYNHDGTPATLPTESSDGTAPTAEAFGQPAPAASEGGSPPAASAVAEQRADDVDEAPADGSTPEPASQTAAATPELPDEPAPPEPASVVTAATETPTPAALDAGPDASPLSAPGTVEAKPSAFAAESEPSKGSGVGPGV